MNWFDWILVVISAATILGLLGELVVNLWNTKFNRLKAFSSWPLQKHKPMQIGQEQKYSD